MRRSQKICSAKVVGNCNCVLFEKDAFSRSRNATSLKAIIGKGDMMIFLNFHVVLLMNPDFIS